MAKLALCIKRADAPQEVIDAFNGTAGMLIPIPASFWNTKVELVDRAICETDETWLQLLPYVAVNSDDGRGVFMYTRGGGGEEARLHGNYSLGVGGHVDVAPDAQLADLGELLNVIQAEAAREVAEEIQVGVSYADMNPTYFICDPTNPVGRVHLGLLINYGLTDAVSIDFVNGLEAGMIENARMIGAQELHTDAVYPRLENWSKLVADAFYSEADEGASDTSFALAGSDSDWDDPNREVGGELIEGAKEDLMEEEEECDECGECDQPLEECTCEPDECEDCGRHVEDCGCDGVDESDDASPDTESHAETKTVVTGGTTEEDDF